MPEELMHELRIAVLDSDCIGYLKDTLFISGLKYEKIDSSRFVVYNEDLSLLKSIERLLDRQHTGFGYHKLFSVNIIKNKKLTEEAELKEKQRKESWDKISKMTEKIFSMGKEMRNGRLYPTYTPPDITELMDNLKKKDEL